MKLRLKIMMMFCFALGLALILFCLGLNRMSFFWVYSTNQMCVVVHLSQIIITSISCNSLRCISGCRHLLGHVGCSQMCHQCHVKTTYLSHLRSFGLVSSCFFSFRRQPNEQRGSRVQADNTAVPRRGTRQPLRSTEAHQGPQQVRHAQGCG